MPAVSRLVSTPVRNCLVSKASVGMSADAAGMSACATSHRNTCEKCRLVGEQRTVGTEVRWSVGFDALQARLVRQRRAPAGADIEQHTSELQSLRHLVCRLLLAKKNNN